MFLDLTCDNIEKFINDLNECNWFSGSYKWLVWTDNLLNGLNRIDKAKISVDTDLTLIEPEFILHDIYKIHYQAPLQSTRLGTWTKETGFVPEKQKDSRTDFGGFTFNVSIAVPEEETNNSISVEILADRLYKADTSPETRFAFNMFLHVKDKFNMRYNYKEASQVGGDLPGSWNGMVNDLAVGDADFGLHPARLRQDTMDYLQPVFTARVVRSFFSLIQPWTFSTYRALIVPFTGEVWAYFGGIIALISVTYRIISKYDKSPDIDSWGATLIQTVGAISQQGFEDRTFLTSSRLVSFFLLLLSAIAFVYYNAAVLNSLLSPSPNTILSIEDLLDSGVELGAWDVPITKDYQSESSIFGTESGLRQEVLNKLNDTDPVYYKLEDAVKKLRGRNFAFISDDSLIFRPADRLLTDAENCAFYQIDTITPFHSTLLLIKGSPYTETLRRTFIWMKEVGLQQRALKLWFDEKTPCRWRQEAVSIGLEALFLSYFIYFGGALLSFLIFIYEYVNKPKALVTS